MRIKAFCAILLIQTAALAASAFGATYQDRIAAIVNGDVILVSDIEARKNPIVRNLMTLPLGVIPPGKLPTDKEILDELIVLQLLEQEADKREVKIDDKGLERSIEMMYKRNNFTREQFIFFLASKGLPFSEFKRLWRRHLKVARLISSEVMRKTPMSEEDAQRYFKENKDKIAEEYKKLVEDMAPARQAQEEPVPEVPTHEEIYVGGRVRLRQITINIPPGASPPVKNRAMEKAKKIYDEAMAGADFAKLAKRYSDDPWAQSGGDLGFMNFKDLIPFIQERTSRMQKGSIAPPIGTGKGIVILYLADAKGRTKKKVPIPERIRKQLEKQIREAKEKRAAQAASRGKNPRDKGDEDEGDASDSAESNSGPSKDLGILTPEEEKEYRKVRKKVINIVRARKTEARMKEWIDGLKADSIIQTRL